jgi:hypothetical protein
MISLLAFTFLQLPSYQYNMKHNTVHVPESVARYCASAVGIPYASDNFSRNDWERFKECAYLQMGEQNK